MLLCFSQLSLERNIVKAACDCKAGVAGKCKHAAAVAVFLTRFDSLSKTSQPRTWGLPAGSKKVYAKFAKPRKLAKQKGMARLVKRLFGLHFSGLPPSAFCYSPYQKKNTKRKDY